MTTFLPPHLEPFSLQRMYVRTLYKIYSLTAFISQLTLNSTRSEFELG